MTRQEQIIDAAYKEAEIERQLMMHPQVFEQGFVAGAKWADRHPDISMVSALAYEAGRNDAIEEVVLMRIYQKEYFKTRDKEVLIKSKHYEKFVDYDIDKKEAAFIATNLWKDAQGDVLPVYDREVVVLIQDCPDDEGHLRVAFGHRPNPNGYVTKDNERLYPMTYGKGGWNGKNVKYWLDVELPIKGD